VLGVVVSAVAISIAAVGIAQALVARHRAEAAADLAALAAAAAWPVPDCSRAAVVARVNGALLSGCTVEGAGPTLEQSGATVRVTVTVPFHGTLARMLAGLGPTTVQARVQARAGPAP
jgi:secretion/DNA translocation related TadE-like protein